MNKKLVSVLTSIFLSCFIIFFQIRMIFSIKSIYYYDMRILNIPKLASANSYTIKHDYDSIIKYLLSPNISVLKIEYFTISQNARMHFKDVKNVLNFDIDLIIISMLAFLCFLPICYKNKDYTFLKYSSWIIFSICLLFLSFFCVNFDKAFILMHKLLFSNRYWIFDEKVDNVINILPQKFFFHSGVCMIFLIIFCGVFLRGIYSIIKKYS